MNKELIEQLEKDLRIVKRVFDEVEIDEQFAIYGVVRTKVIKILKDYINEKTNNNELVSVGLIGINTIENKVLKEISSDMVSVDYVRSVLTDVLEGLMEVERGEITRKALDKIIKEMEPLTTGEQKEIIAYLTATLHYR